jgi:MFS family permease
VLLFGWSFLEGVGAALILPAIVALVAGNFPAARRPAAYGMVAAAGAIAVAVGPLIGGIFTTYFSWRWVFAGEVLIVIVILIMARRIADAPPETRPQLDLVGAVLSATGLALLVFGVLRSSEWGWIKPKEGGTSWWGLSPTIWLVLAGGFVLWLFLQWAAHRERQGKEPLIRPVMLQNKQLRGGLTMFFFQYLAQAGLRGAALPLGRARPLGTRDGCAPDTALDHALGGGDRCPAPAPECEPSPSRPPRPPHAAASSIGSSTISGPESMSSAPIRTTATDETVVAYQEARITGLKSGLAILALATILALVFTRALPTVQPKGVP